MFISSPTTKQKAQIEDSKIFSNYIENTLPLWSCGICDETKCILEMVRKSVPRNKKKKKEKKSLIDSIPQEFSLESTLFDCLREKRNKLASHAEDTANIEEIQNRSIGFRTHINGAE
jgi:hypothetical protein